ncbi:hypothetical protein [Taibaiella chishuiensis]|uniref:Uncharacterized protein n=1 Tax=Taibaiella chishuiensis TaxID=1434707 RepID=A0A2P8D8L9_9BACT|nr:hypothetical protein [Taibaiella chishuiensis]PSK93527.1 hypothetical protein B0I18_102497 [Taibaiella chishuiensis]
MKTTNFKVLSENEQQLVTGGSEGTIVGWRYHNGMYYADISYESGETSCDVPWGSSMPQMGSSVG